MTKMNIMKYSTLALLALSMGACTKDVDYDPASAQTNAQVFFSSDEASEVELQENQNSFTIEVSRVNASGSVTVDVTSFATVGEESSDIFSVPSSVTFADGAKTAEIPVTFDFNEIKPETDYVVTVSLEGDALSLYGKTTQEVTVYYAPWSEWKKMDGEGILTLATYWSGSYPYDVYTRNSLLNPDNVQYMVPDVLDTDMYNLTINVNKATNEVTVPQQCTDYVNSNYGEKIYVCDVYTYVTEVNPKAAGDTPVENFKRMSYFDPETGLITMNTVYYISLGMFNNDYETLQLPGYPDYNMYASQDGSFIDDAGREYAVITLTKGSDVASYAVELIPGNLTSAEAQEAADAIVANTETELYADGKQFQFPISESGVYTLLTVSYGSDGLNKGWNSYVFEYEIQTINNYGWVPVKTQCLFTDAFMAGLFDDEDNPLESPLSWFVEVQEYEDAPGYYRLVKPYATVAEIYGMEPYSGIFNIVIDATDPDNVYIPMQYNCFGYIIAASAYGKLENNKITFPAGSCGVVGRNDEGQYYLPYPWREECVVLDLNYTGEDDTEAEPAPATRSGKMGKAHDVKKSFLMPYEGGKKLTKKEKKLTNALRK